MKTTDKRIVLFIIQGNMLPAAPFRRLITVKWISGVGGVNYLPESARCGIPICRNNMQ